MQRMTTFYLVVTVGGNVGLPPDVTGEGSLWGQVEIPTGFGILKEIMMQIRTSSSQMTVKNRNDLIQGDTCQEKGNHPGYQ